MAYAKYKKLKYEYQAERLDIHNLPEITHEDAKEVLFHTQDVLKRINLELNLTFGTLLGAVREKDFIKGDFDVDTFIKDEEVLFRNLAFIEANGLQLIRAIKHRLYSFRYKKNPNCYIDIYIYQKAYNIWGIYCSQLNGLMIPKKYLKEGTINFLGRTFFCPSRPEQILEFWYTDTWRTPIGKFGKKYKYEVASHFYYIRIKKAIKFAIQDLIKMVIGKDCYTIILSKIKSWF